jgi:hypothetical protein
MLPLSVNAYINGLRLCAPGDQVRVHEVLETGTPPLALPWLHRSPDRPVVVARRKVGGAEGHVDPGRDAGHHEQEGAVGRGPAALAFDAPESPGRQAFMAAVDGIAQCQQAGAARTTDDPFRLAAMAWAAIHGLVMLRLDRPHFPWPPLDDMATDSLRRLLALPPP